MPPQEVLLKVLLEARKLNKERARKKNAPPSQDPRPRESKAEMKVRTREEERAKKEQDRALQRERERVLELERVRKLKEEQELDRVRTLKEEQERARQREREEALLRQTVAFRRAAFEGAVNFVSGFLSLATLMLGLWRLQGKTRSDDHEEGEKSLTCPRIDPYVMEETIFPFFPNDVGVPVPEMFDNLTAVVCFIEHNELWPRVPEFYLICNTRYETRTRTLIVDYETAKKEIINGARVFGEAFPDVNPEPVQDLDSDRYSEHRLFEEALVPRFG